MRALLTFPGVVIWLLSPLALIAEEPGELEPIIVYGERLADDDFIAPPGSDTTITASELAQSGADSVAALLEGKAGLPILSYYGNPGLGSPIIRGFGENASSRTLILLDGIPLNPPDLSSAPWFQVPLSNIEQLKVLRGSRTVRYGSSALGGVISLETKPSYHEVSGSLESSIGSFQSNLYRGKLNLPLGDWSLGLFADHNQSDGYRKHSGFDSTACGASLYTPESDFFEGRWLLSANDLSFENPRSLSREQYLDDPRQSIVDDFNQGDQFINENRSLQLAQKLTWKKLHEKKLTLNTSWLHRERESNFGQGSHGDQDLDTWFLEAVLSRDSHPLSWEIGLRSQFDDLHDSRFLDLDRETRLGKAELERFGIGVFALSRYQYNDQLAFTEGISWDYWSLEARSQDDFFPLDPLTNFLDSVDGQGFGAELSIEYSLNNDWTLWARYDRVYRFPVIDEIAAYQGFILAKPFNADLDPEKGHSLEVGWNYDLAPWRYEGSLFSLWLGDEIGYDYRENLNTNFADTHRIGLENRLHWQSEQLAWSLNHSLTFASYRNGEFNGKDVPLIPRNIFSGQLDWTPVANLSFGLEVLFVDESPEGNDFSNTQEYLPSRWLFNSRARWIIRDEIEVYLRADNLFDRQYTSLKFQERWYPGDGRKLSLGLKLTF